MVDPYVEFKEVVVGETAHQSFTIRNDGAISASYTIVDPSNAKVSKENSDQPDYVCQVEKAIGLEDNPENPFSFSTHGTLGAYSTRSIQVNFHPMNVKTYELPLVIKWEYELQQPQPIGHHEEPIIHSLLLRGVSVPVKIFAFTPVVDFKCCIYEKLYRSKVIVGNR